MSQQHLSDSDAPSFRRPDLLVSSHHAHAPTAPQQLQGPPDSLYNSLYSQIAHDAFVDLPDSSLVPASFGAHSLRTANSIGTHTGLNSIKPRPAGDADTFRNLDLNAQHKIGPSKSDLSPNVLPVPSQLAEAAGVTGPASGLPPRRANVDYGMLPQNTPLIPMTHIPPQPLQAPVPTLTALPMAQSSAIQSSAGCNPMVPMPQSPVLPGTQPPLNQQQILQLITSQSPSQSPAAAAQLAQLLQSPNAQPILTQLAAMMGSAQTAPPPTQTQEEISTIFVVGFPDDMTEREFQNMFTFCPGYEAATLKMPAKDTPSFPNGQSTAGSGLRGAFPGSGVSPRQAAALAAANAVSNAIAGASDPYNLVTVNSGGVVVDQGNNQTATTSSAWSTGLDDVYARSLIATSIAASNASTATDLGVAGGANTGGSNLQSRKQIIGFAKFRTRQEALEARDVLHGRRVDIEKGSVLKAEMAKKNLHTKRGVGSLQGPSTATNATNANNINGLAASGMLSPDNHALGPAAGVSSSTGLSNAMDSPLSSGAPAYSASATSRVHDADPFKVTHPIVNAMPTFQPQGPGAALTSNIGFPPHDPSGILPRDLLYSPGRSEPSNPWALSDPSPISAQNEQPTLHSGPGEPYVRHRNGQLDGKTGALSPPSMGSSLSSLPPRPASSVNSSSPPTTSCASNDTEVGAGYNSDYSTRSFSPNESMANSLVGGMQSPDSHMDAMSKVMQIMQGTSKVHMGSGGGLVGSPGDQTLTEGSLSSVGRQMQALSSQGGESVRTSSDSSTGSRRNNTADQNPPINTLYVGNLPSSQAPQSKYLEEALLTLFSRCPGYRKLCFRQKTNGPMCFVEFDDVPSATRALKEQYGNTLNGLVKGGIRLSYSKNPLGVRTAVPNGPSQPPSLVGSPLGSPTTQIPPVPLQFGMNPPMGSLHDVHPRGGLSITGADLPSRLRNDEHSMAFASSPPNRLLASPPPISSGGGAFAAITSRSHNRAPISIASPSGSSIHQSLSFTPATSPPTAGPLFPGSTFQPFGSTEPTSQGQWPQFP